MLMMILHVLLGATQLNSSLLTVSVIAVLLPAAFQFTSNASTPQATINKDILAVSHGVCCIRPVSSSTLAHLPCVLGRHHTLIQYVFLGFTLL